MCYKCCIKSCTSTRKDTSAHFFPKDVMVLQKWLECINCERLRSMSFKELRKQSVCRKHFEKRFLGNTRDRDRLRYDAYPTLFTTTEISSGIPETVIPPINREYFNMIKKQHGDHTYSKIEELEKFFNFEPEIIVPEPASYDGGKHNVSGPSHSEPTEIPEANKTKKIYSITSVPPKLGRNSLKSNKVIVQKPVYHIKILKESGPSDTEPTENPEATGIIDQPAYHIKIFNELDPSDNEPTERIPEANELNVQKPASQQVKIIDDPSISDPSDSEPTEIPEANDIANIVTKATRTKKCTPTKKSRRVTCTARCAMLRNICRKAQKQTNYYRRTRKAFFSKTFEKLTMKMNPLAKHFIWRQIHQNKKKGKGRRFSEEEKFIALSILKLSRNCYIFLQSIFDLPSRHTLNRMIAKMNVKADIKSQE